MNIGVPRETASGERRVALLPDNAKRLIAIGHKVIVETNAGHEAGAYDDAYRDMGADICSSAAELYDRSDIILKVQRPQPDIELPWLSSGKIVIGLLQPLMNLELIRQFQRQLVTSFSMDAIPRITRAQSMDALSSQSTVAGYRAAILAAVLLPRLYPLLMTAAGTIIPARVLILGAGVAGLQAIATARRLGAVVQAFDTRPAVREQVESLGASFLTLSLEVTGAEAAGGYARQLESDLEAKERALLQDPVAHADVVISTAMVPGSRAPLLIDDDMVHAMRPGSVIIDLAAETGGNCALTEPGRRIVTPNGIVIEGTLNLPAQVPVHASQLYAQNLTAFLTLLLEAGIAPGEAPGQWTLNLDADEIVRATCITHAGNIVHQPTLQRIQAKGEE